MKRTSTTGVHLELVLLWCIVFDGRLTSLIVAGEICTNATCVYDFKVTEYESMTYRDESDVLWDVYLNGTQLQADVNGETILLSQDDIVVADGYKRSIMTINRQFPGPTIEVLNGTQIVVRLTNHLFSRILTLHWHGIRQLNNYHMDGTEYVTQCPVPPGQSFTYKFWADTVGTHWYHAHNAAVRLDGLFGLLIVHPTMPTIPQYSLSVNDWNHINGDLQLVDGKGLCENGGSGPSYRTSSGKSATDCSFEGAGLGFTVVHGALIGARGRYDKSMPFPLSEYVLTSGRRHRFRLVNAGHVVPFEISADGHAISIVASDGSEIEPIPVDSFFIHIGETIDFEFVADQTPGRYWLRADTQCGGEHYSNAILVYEGFETEHADPVSERKNCTADTPCVVFNCPYGRYPDGYNRTCISMADANSTLSSQELSDRYGVGNTTEVDVAEYVLNFAMVSGSSINGRRFMMPMEPIYQNESAAMPCVGEPCLNGCDCRCTIVQELPLGKTVQFVITNYQPDPRVEQHAYHTIHLHGNPFALIAEEFPTYNHTTGQVITANEDLTCDNDVLCAHPHWVGTPPDFSDNEHPVIKDTVVLPMMGYVVLRFRTLNPGYWAFHCHLDVHAAGGMMMVLKVEPERVPIPAGFPKCFDTSNFQP